MGDAHLDIVDFLPVSTDARARLRTDLERKTTTVAREAGRVVPLLEVIAATGAALGTALGRDAVTFEPGPLLQGEATSGQSHAAPRTPPAAP